MSYYPLTEKDYSRLIVVLSLNNFLRGICHGIIIPGLFITTTSVTHKQLRDSYNWFLLAVALFESFQVLGKLLIYVKSHFSFIRSAYFKFLILSLLSSSLYVLSLMYNQISALLAALAIQGLWRGCLDKMENVLLNEIDKQHKEPEQEFIQHCKSIGLIIGPLIGYFINSFSPVSSIWEGLPDLSSPGIVQLLCVVLMVLIHLIVRIEIFKPSKLKISENVAYALGESETLGNNSVENSKKVEENHLYIFTAMFIIMNYSFSRSVKEVALPILMNKLDGFNDCNCEVNSDKNIIYLAFAASGFFESFSLIIAHRPKSVSVKKMLYIPLVLSIAGNAVMISNGSISILLLGLGIALQSFSNPFGLICGRVLLSRYIGINGPSYFVFSKLFLEFLGSLIGPFYTLQAYMVKCGLCFSMITIIFIINFLLAAYAHVKKHYEKKNKEKNSILEDSKPDSFERMTGRKKRTLLQKKKTLIETEMVNLKKKN